MFLKKLPTKDMVVLGFLTIIVAVLAVFMITIADNDNIIRVDIADGVSKEVTFNRVALAPGESCDYTLLLELEEVVPYDITFDFTELKNVNLKNYVYVKIIANNHVVCDKLLADIFKEDTIHLHVDPAEIGSEKIEVIYYMPLGVGNEAQRTRASFSLYVKATSEPVEEED